MRRFTVSVPKDLKKELDLLPHINWPEIAKQAIVKKLEELYKLEDLKNKRKL